MSNTILHHGPSRLPHFAGGLPPTRAAPAHTGDLVMFKLSHSSARDTLERADKHFRRMRAALNASEGGWADRMFARWRVRWRVHRLRTRLRELGVPNSALPPQRKAFVRKQVAIEITDVAWHEQLRLWWWPPKLSPNIDP